MRLSAPIDEYRACRDFSEQQGSHFGGNERAVSARRACDVSICSLHSRINEHAPVPCRKRSSTIRGVRSLVEDHAQPPSGAPGDAMRSVPALDMARILWLGAGTLLARAFDWISL